jgi:hypothetical protein
MFYSRCRLMVYAVAVCVACAFFSAAQEPQLNEEQMRDFLLTAKVLSWKEVSKGITGVQRLTMNDGKITHDASFQSVDEAKIKETFNDGRTEMNFRDSYKYNLAAYELAKLVGLGDMMPVTVERRWNGRTGSLSWWLPVKMDEEKRLKNKIEPPDADAWNKQMHKMRVFSQLVYDTDRNLGNVLISEAWHLWMIDFSRAFRRYTDLENPKNLVKCQRQLLERLRRLDAAEVADKTGNWLNKEEIKAMMARRNKIVAVFEALIAKNGEKEVIYD